MNVHADGEIGILRERRTVVSQVEPRQSKSNGDWEGRPETLFV